MSLGQELVVWPSGLAPGDLEAYGYDDRLAPPGAAGPAGVTGVSGLNSLAVAAPGGLEASGMGVSALGGQGPVGTANVFEMASPPQGVVASLHQHTHPHTHHHSQHQGTADRQPTAGTGSHDPQLVNEQYAQAYVAALAARLQPQFAIGDDIATDADMSDLPEVLDLHQPAVSHRGSMACTQEPGDGAGSLVLVPQDPTSALQTAVLPNLHFDHLDKNALFDLLQAPGPPELRPSTQRYFDGAGSQGTSSHSAPYITSGGTSQASPGSYSLENYNYSPVSIVAAPPVNHHLSTGNNNHSHLTNGSPVSGTGPSIDLHNNAGGSSHSSSPSHHHHHHVNHHSHLVHPSSCSSHSGPGGNGINGGGGGGPHLPSSSTSSSTSTSPSGSASLSSLSLSSSLTPTGVNIGTPSSVCSSLASHSLQHHHQPHPHGCNSSSSTHHSACSSSNHHLTGAPHHASNGHHSNAASRSHHHLSSPSATSSTIAAITSIGMTGHGGSSTSSSGGSGTGSSSVETGSGDEGGASNNNNDQGVDSVHSNHSGNSSHHNNGEHGGSNHANNNNTSHQNHQSGLSSHHSASSGSHHSGGSAGHHQHVHQHSQQQQPEQQAQGHHQHVSQHLQQHSQPQSHSQHSSQTQPQFHHLVNNNSPLINNGNGGTNNVGHSNNNNNGSVGAGSATGGGQSQNQNYPINHKQMLAQKYAAEELQNSAYSQMIGGLGGLGTGGSGLGTLMGGSSASSGGGLVLTSASSTSTSSSATLGVNGVVGVSGVGGVNCLGSLQLDCGGVDSTGLLHPQLYMGSVDPMQTILCKDDTPNDLLEGTIVGVDLSLSKSHANTSLCPQNRIPSQIVNVNQRQDGVSVLRPPKKDRSSLQSNRRSPQPKDDCGTFCDECGLFYEKECSQHRVLMIKDERIQSRAFATLPSNHLVIQNVASNVNGPPVYAVFSRNVIPLRTMFGPMEGVPIKTTQKPNVPFPIFLSEDVSGCVILDTRDEERSNWMSFVRTAASPSEQNMAIVQQGGQIFFKVVTQILPKTELKVWYSDAYIQRYRLQQNVCECFDCGSTFSNSEILIQHFVNEHNDAQHLSSLTAAAVVPAGHPAAMPNQDVTGQLCQVRKPKIPRYPSSGQWQESSTSRQQHSASQMTGTVLIPTANELSNPNLYLTDSLIDNLMPRKSKRNYPMHSTCAQDALLLYNTADKALDAVELIEHITQLSNECGASLQTEIIASDGYSCMSSPLTIQQPQQLPHEQDQPQQHPASTSSEQQQQHQQDQAQSSSTNRDLANEFFETDRCVDFAQVETPVQTAVETPPVNAAPMDVTAVQTQPLDTTVEENQRQTPSVTEKRPPPTSAASSDQNSEENSNHNHHQHQQRRYDAVDHLDDTDEVIDEATMYYPCKKKRTDAREKERVPCQTALSARAGDLVAPVQQRLLHNSEQPKVVPSKISKFLQRRNEEVASRSPEETTSSLHSSSSMHSVDSSVRSDETTSDSSNSSLQEELPPPLPQQKRFIKNIKNKHYVRADSNLTSIDNIDSPLPSEESASPNEDVATNGETCELTEPNSVNDRRNNVGRVNTDGGDNAERVSQGESPPRSKSPKATFMTPLKKKLPKSIMEETQPKRVNQLGLNGGEVQSAEVTSAGSELPSEGSIHMQAAIVAVTSGKEKKKRLEYPCLLCEQSFSYVTTLRLHSKEHSTPEGFKCPKCPRTLNDFLMLRRHIRLYHIYPTTKSFRCETCGKTFCQTDKYKRHIRVHEAGDKKFKCDICGKILSRKDKLLDHVRNMHSEENSQEPGTKKDDEEGSQTMDTRKAPPDSTQPALSTPEKCRLKREGAGIQVRSFQCDQCGRGFRKRGMLAQHYAKQHPELPPESTSLEDQFEKVISEFPCPYCDKSYKSSTKRKQHIEQNHPMSEVPQSYKTLAASVRVAYVKCPWCLSQYTVRCKLYAHQRAKHQKLLDILNVTGITDDSWEKVDLEKKAACMKIQAAIEAELLKRKEQQENSAISKAGSSDSSATRINNAGCYSTSTGSSAAAKMVGTSSANHTKRDPQQHHNRIRNKNRIASN